MKCKDPYKNCDDWECQKAGKCLSNAPSIEIGELVDDKFLVVHDVVEHEDGTATVQLDLGKDALRLLVEIGFHSIVRAGIEQNYTANADEEKAKEQSK